MVSRVPTFSAKTLGSRISRDLVLPLLGVAALAVVTLIAFTWEMLTAMSILYIALLPVGIRSYRTAAGDTVDPVAPCSLSGCSTKANS